MKQELSRMMKLFRWGDDNNVSISMIRFKQVHTDKKSHRHLWEVLFKQYIKNQHRLSRGTSESLDEAMDFVWKDYKRKRFNEK